METTNTIKGKEVIAYKYMDKNMCCSGFQYEIGKTYKTDKVKINECGFHACLNPQDTFIFYSQGKNSRYFKVKLSGEIAKCGMWDTNVAATEITILEEINAYEIINIAEWWKNENVLELLYYSNGLAQIINCERKYNFIDKNGKLLSDKWFEFADYFDNDGLALIQREDGLQNYIDANGKLLSDEWFEWLDYFHNEFARIKEANGEYNYIDKQGKILSEEWFRFADYFDNDGFAEVYRTNGEQCKIDKNGKIVVCK